MTTRDVDIAWAAGLFEGEGCFQKSGTSPTIVIQMTDLDVIERFGRIIGVGNLNGPYKYGVQRKPSWKWAAHGIENFRLVVDLFRPFLGVRRTAKADELLTWALQRPGRGRWGDPRGHQLASAARWAK